MEAFSLAVRRQIIELFQSGLEGDDVAEFASLLASGSRRIWQRYREEGLVDPRPHAGGHTPKLSDEQKKQVLSELVKQKPDAFCRELVDELHAATGVRVCPPDHWKLAGRVGAHAKKSRSSPPSNKDRTCKRSVKHGSTRLPMPARATLPA